MFSTIQDSVDTNLNVVVHLPTGFFNIAAAAKQYNDSKGADMKIAEWNRSAQTKELIAATKEQYGLDKVTREFNANTGRECKGTYVHPALYRAFLMWLNVTYALKIFAIIEKHQQEHTEKLKYELRRETERANTSEDKIDHLMKAVNTIIQQNEDLKLDIKDTKDTLTKKISTVANMLKEKSLCSTRNPSNPTKHHNFVVMGYKFIDVSTGLSGWMLSFIAGQESHVRTAMAKKYEDGDYDWTVQIQMHYNANPIDLRNNIQERVKTYIGELVTKTNAERINSATTSNEQLREEIIQHNADNPKAKRSFTKEKVKVVKIKNSDIPIRYQKTAARYLANDHILYEKLLEVITGVNTETQASPYEPEESEEPLSEVIIDEEPSDGDHTDVEISDEE